MGSMTQQTTEYVVPRADVWAVASQIAVRNRAQAGTPGAFTGGLRLVTASTVVMDDVFAPFPGTAVPGGPPA